MLDSDHGWLEIHPVWSIIVGATASSPPITLSPPPKADTETSGPPATGSAPVSSGASCQVSATPSNDGDPGDYEAYVHSNQPGTKATASDAGDTWSENTNASGYADIRLYQNPPGMAITVTVGAAS